MRKNLLTCLALGFFVSGCATTQSNSVSEAEIAKLQTRNSVLEEELSQKQEENLSLKEKIAQLEKTVIKMPTGKEIQIALKNAGFYQGTIDGQIGQKTKDAIRKFQEAKGLTGDGVIGSRTWEILGKHLKK